MSIQLEEQIKVLEICDIRLRPDITIDNLLYSFDREKYEKEPYVLLLTDKPKKAPCLQRGDEFGVVESSRRFSPQTPNYLLYHAHALMFAASAYRKPMCADVWL